MGRTKAMIPRGKATRKTARHNRLKAAAFGVVDEVTMASSWAWRGYHQPHAETPRRNRASDRNPVSSRITHAAALAPRQGRQLAGDTCPEPHTVPVSSPHLRVREARGRSGA